MLSTCLIGMTISIPDLSYTYLWGIVILFSYFISIMRNQNDFFAKGIHEQDNYQLSQS